MTTTITSIEELEALPPNTSITVRNLNGTITATRTETGFTMNTATLPTEFFSGAVAAERVTAQGRFEVGSVYHDTYYDRYYYVVGEPTEADPTIYMMRKLNDGAASIEMHEYPVDSPPERAVLYPAGLGSRSSLLAARGLGIQWARLRREQKTAITVNDGLTIRERVLNEVAAYMRQEWDGSSFNEDEVNEVFTHFGIDEPIAPPAMEEVEVTVNVTGTLILSIEEVEEMIHGDRAADVDDSIEVSWTWDWSRIYEVDQNECACDHVERSEVAAALNEEGIRYSSFEWSADCCNG